MNVNDKRVKSDVRVPFSKLKIGQVYEDKDKVLCIKTRTNKEQDNCICFVNGKWENFLEFSTTKVTPLIATLEIEG